jgi:hypothetical protein
LWDDNPEKLLGSAEEHERRRHADLRSNEVLVKIVNGCNRPPFETDDGVTFLQSSCRRWATRFHFHDQHSTLVGQFVESNDSRMEWHVLASHAN